VAKIHLSCLGNADLLVEVWSRSGLRQGQLTMAVDIVPQAL
jgi:hypothetical protein